jgi:tetratricopeptide (TPR) repeat protein
LIKGAAVERGGSRPINSTFGSNPTGRTGIFARNGEYWAIGYLGATFSLRDIKGLSYIQRLLRHPGKEFLALDLLSEPGSSAGFDRRLASEVLGDPNISIGGLGDAGEMLDARAKQDYRRRRLELTEKLEDLHERGDLKRAEEIEAEIEFLERELARAVGLGGRDRRAGSASERARLNVSRAIRAALQKISEHDASLGQLLERSIRTGSFCRADPQVFISWQFALEASRVVAEAEPAAPLLTETNFPRVFADQTKFVGREQERTTLQRCLDQVSHGEGRVVMIGGEPGVGKTRLAREAGAEASEKGFLVLAGSCYDRDDPIPFGPLVEMLEARARGPDQTAFREALGNDASEIARLMPQLRRLFPDIDPPAQPSAELSRQILFTALSELLARAAANRPVFILLEDLHWADEGTLSVLNFLSRRIFRIPVMIVGTHRDSELDPGGPLAKTLDELIRVRLLERINLRGLPRRAVAEMIQAISGRAPPEALVSLIFSNAEGNPFFIEELFRHLAEHGQLTDSNGELRHDLMSMEIDVPQSLRLVIGRRLARLSGEAQMILGFAAVIGRSFTFEMLEVATDRDPEQLLDHVEAAERTGLISSALDYPAARFTFSHELVRHAVLEGLSLPRRQRIHLRVVKAIERLRHDALEDHANDLAYHMLQAGTAADPRGTVRYLAMAAKREISLSAYESAMYHLKTALELLPKLPEPRERNLTELNLLTDYGVTLLVLRGWHVPEMGEVYKRARELCKQLSETQRLTSVLFGLAAFHLLRAELRVSRTYVDEMNSLASESDDDKMVLVGWSMGATRFFMGEFADAHEGFEQAVRYYDGKKHRAIAFSVGQDLCAGSMVYDAMTLLILGFPDRAESRLQEAISLARDLGYPFTLTYCLTMAAKYYCIRRDFSRLPEIVQEASALAKEHGFTFYEEGITAYHIIGLAAEGKLEELKASIGRSTKFSEIRYELALTWARSTLAESFGNLGRIKTALLLLNEASAMMKRNDERYVESEIERIRGVLALKQIESHQCTELDLQSARAEAEKAFREAKEISRRQGAKLFELRASTSLGRLLIMTGRSGEARRILGEIYDSFTEGFEAPDLLVARAILEELSTAHVKPETPSARD